MIGTGLYDVARGLGNGAANMGVAGASIIAAPFYLLGGTAYHAAMSRHRGFYGKLALMGIAEGVTVYQAINNTDDAKVGVAVSLGTLGLLGGGYLLGRAGLGLAGRASKALRSPSSSPGFIRGALESIDSANNRLFEVARREGGLLGRYPHEHLGKAADNLLENFVGVSPHRAFVGRMGKDGTRVRGKLVTPGSLFTMGLGYQINALLAFNDTPKDRMGSFREGLHTNLGLSLASEASGLVGMGVGAAIGSTLGPVTGFVGMLAGGLAGYLTPYAAHSLAWAVADAGSTRRRSARSGFMDSPKAATMRQQSLEILGTSQFNARSALGREASLYHY